MGLAPRDKAPSAHSINTPIEGKSISCKLQPIRILPLRVPSNASLAFAAYSLPLNRYRRRRVHQSRSLEKITPARSSFHLLVHGKQADKACCIRHHKPVPHYRRRSEVRCSRTYFAQMPTIGGIPEVDCSVRSRGAYRSICKKKRRRANTSQRRLASWAQPPQGVSLNGLCS